MSGLSYLDNFVAALLKTGPDDAANVTHTESSARPFDDCPYLIQAGRTWRRTFARSDGQLVEVERKVIADFAVRIVAESRFEDGQVWFTLAGETAEGASMRCSLPVADFIVEKALLIALTTAAGARGVVHAGMSSHLRPAIQLLSPTDLPVIRCFHRTGWAELDGARRFLLPGREIAGVEVRLRKLPYHVPRVALGTTVERPSTASGQLPPDSAQDAFRLQADAPRLARGLAGFRSLLSSLEPARTTVIAALLFQAPLARPAGWANERYAVFISGRTGSLKTSFSQALLCLYGAGFAEDQHLLKLGEGATRNALLSYAEQAHDMPLLVDNYKPNTGDGARGLVNLLHNLIEGSGRERLNKDSQLQEARPIACWPLLTGEDAPRGDAAALARLLVVPVRWPSEGQRPLATAPLPAGTDSAQDAAGGGHNPHLARAQAAAADFPLLGGAWLDWLETDAGAAAARAAGQQFAARRAAWAGRLTGRTDRAANPLRLASNLASNELTWQVLARHPLLGPVAREFAEHHAAGLALLAREMARQTAENVEAARFVEVLRQLLASGACRLLERGESSGEQEAPEPTAPARNTDRGQVIGWHAPDGGAYLMPDIARRAVEGVLGPDGLNRISMEALYAQLDELGFLGERGQGRRTKNIFLGGRRTARVLHLTAAALSGEEPASEY